MDKKTPIDSLKKKYLSHSEHLRAVEDALMEQFDISEGHRAQVTKAVRVAFSVGHGTMTTDDWCDS